jgi:2-polyprenyl-3-methyl-5-hydroxy-6-metoxy-1,4-benzoquinol methylase
MAFAEPSLVLPNAYPETADIETSSDGYAARFSGATGTWMLAVQERITLAMLPPPEKTTILDVGGGHGQLALPLCRLGYAVTVVGSAESCRRRVAEAIDGGRCRFTMGNVLDLPFPDRAFDTAMSFRLMTHCAAWPALVAELCRVASQSVIVDYPVNGGVHALAPALFDAKKKLEGNTRPWRPFRHEEVNAEFRKHGFAPDCRVPQFFLPLALHRLLRCRGLSAALEGFCRGVGLTGRWGSPVIVRMRRVSSTPAAA